MGVHGLWRLLESTGKPINPETLEGKILAVDISIWLNQAVKGVRDRSGNSVQNAHLLTLFHRICKLLFFRIKPVFVFDGEAPLLKRQTLALRRQRKEELNQESKQTNEKLLKTFLKRQAIKAVLGEQSKDPLPSLSTVRRDEVDDMYVLPALPAAEEKDKSSSDEEQGDWDESVDSYNAYEGEFYDHPNSVDINSEEFTSLPPEMKHEILKEMKEFSKRRRTMYHKPPEQSGDFSQYQLAGLLQRNKLNQRLESVEKEMSQHSASCAPGVCDQEGEQQSHSVESKRLVSEDHSHYILIKGSKKTEPTPIDQTGPPAWSGDFLSGIKKRAAGRPEPLWRPASEEAVKRRDSSLEESKPSTSKLSQGDEAPPSPRTLKAIEAAMAESSDEERVDPGKKNGHLSPRTMLAIQEALAEEEDGSSDQGGPRCSAPPKQQVTVLHPAPQVITCSSEDEAETSSLTILPSKCPSAEKKLLSQTVHVKDSLLVSGSEDEAELSSLTILPGESQNADKKPLSQNVHVRDSLLVSSSEDEMEEAIAQRNKVFRATMLEKVEEKKAEKEPLKDGTGTESGKQEEPQTRAALSGDLVSSNLISRLNGEVAPRVRDLPISPSPQIFGKPLSAEIKNDTRVPEQKANESAAEDRAEVKSEAGDKSESEESFIEVSEEEFNNEEVEVATGKEMESPEDISEDQLEEEKTTGGSLSETKEDDDEISASEEKEPEQGTEEESSAAPAVNEWEDFDADELAALDSSLQAEQSNLRELKQQQERMANTVTGQMYLESQELLRLFGIPFLVAPTEAEAQCAALDRSDHTHGTITDDSDVWLFGGRHVYKNFFSQNKFVEHYQFSDLQNQLGLDRTKLINLAYLLGSDYTEGVAGVGYVTGMEILNEFAGPGLEPLIEFSKWWSVAQEKKRVASDPRDTKVKKKLRELKLFPGFPNPAVAQAYLQPTVDQSDGSFSWGRPQVDMIKEFCSNRFGWNSRRTDETLQPVIKQLNTQQTQLRIDAFFRMEQQEKQAIRSQRLRRAVTCMKRKDREDGEESEDESPTPTPSKSRRGKAVGAAARGGEREERQTEVGGGGGFLGSEDVVEPSHDPVMDVSLGGPECTPVTVPPTSESQPPRLRRRSSSSSSSSEEDRYGSKGAAMVTARSIFNSSRGGIGKRARQRGGMRGR